MIIHATPGRGVKCVGTRCIDGGFVGLWTFAFAPLCSLEAEADLSIGGVDPEDLDIDLFVGLDDVLRVFDLLVRELGDVEQAFKTVFQFNEDAEVGDLGDGAVDDHAGLVGLGNRGVPGILGQLLDAESDTLLVLVYFQDDAFDGFALLELLVRRAPFFRDLVRAVLRAVALALRAAAGRRQRGF